MDHGARLAGGVMLGGGHASDEGVLVSCCMPEPQASFVEVVRGCLRHGAVEAWRARPPICEHVGGEVLRLSDGPEAGAVQVHGEGSVAPVVTAGGATTQQLRSIR